MWILETSVYLYGIEGVTRKYFFKRKKEINKVLFTDIFFYFRISGCLTYYGFNRVAMTPFIVVSAFYPHSIFSTTLIYFDLVAREALFILKKSPGVNKLRWDYVRYVCSISISSSFHPIISSITIQGHFTKTILNDWNNIDDYELLYKWLFNWTQQ